MCPTGATPAVQHFCSAAPARSYPRRTSDSQPVDTAAGESASPEPARSRSLQRADGRMRALISMQYPVTWLQPQWFAARRIKRFLDTLRRSRLVLHLGAGGKRVEGAINCDLHDP